jgi:hypothetical protein
MYMQRTTSDAAGNGLHTTTKYMRGAAGTDLGTRIKYLRRTTSDLYQVPAMHNERRREQWPEHHDHPPCSVAALVINPETHTGARPSVRLCVVPELARCVHKYIYFQADAYERTRRIMHAVTQTLNFPRIKLRAPHRGTSFGSFALAA